MGNVHSAETQHAKKLNFCISDKEIQGFRLGYKFFSCIPFKRKSEVFVWDRNSFLAYRTEVSAIFISANKSYLKYPHPTRGIDKPEDHWSCIPHLSVEDMLKSAVIGEKKFKNIESE